jgi:Domain of unknown function (DUF4349)
MRFAYFAIIFVLFSCQKKSELRLGTTNKDVWSPMNVASDEEKVDEMAVDVQSTAPLFQTERKLIKNGSLIFKVDDVKEAKLQLDKLIKEANGYPSNETQSNSEDRLEYNIIVRVPASKFDEFINNTIKLADKVDSKNIATEDVTEQFIDTEARLKTKKELEVRFREILKQAKNVEEILSIESQLSNVRTEIEAVEGKLNYLKSQISMSTINITYYEVIGIDFGFGSKFIHSFAAGWDNLLSFIVGITSLWPFVLALAGGVFWFMRWRKKKATNV